MKNKDFAQSFFSFFQNNKSFLTKEDVEYLASSHDFGNYTVLKESHGSPDEEYKEDGYQRYYKEFLLDFYGKKFLVSQQWYSRQSPYNLQKFAEWLIKKAKEKNFPKDKIPSEFFEGMNLPKGEAVERDNDNENVINESQNGNSQSKVHQKIFFGAPGTGKSFKANAILGKNRKKSFSKSDYPKRNGYANDLCDVNNVGFEVWSIDNIEFLEKKLVSFESDNKVTNPRHSALRAYIDFFKKYREENRENRTTFHPDYDYAQFVGAYKPKKESGSITYSFVPQVFAKAYAAAWKLYLAAGKVSTAENQVYLVIEEINRGNCAQIFGDIFQLLDRDSEGFSQYSIDADCDFAEWLKDNGIGDGKLKLPPNLNILATMNTSDQSLFPMDSAFKRRFDWEYVPISFTDEKGNEKEAAKYEIDVPDANGKNYLWKNFVEAVNDKILDLTESEDKQLGEFFIKPDNGYIISKDRFLGKVMFYLWNEVCKDEHKNGSFFRAKINDKEDFFTFQDLYKKKDLLKLFMDGLLAPKN